MVVTRVMFAPTRMTFDEEVEIELERGGKIDSCLFLKPATIIYGKTGVVEYCQFRDDITIKSSEEALESPTDRVFQWNLFPCDKLVNVHGAITVKDNMSIRYRPPWF